LLRHNWPGNVRELRNVLERALILAGAGTVELKHLPLPFQGHPAAAAPEVAEFPVGTTVSEVERVLILRTIEHTRNNKTRAAEILGISLKTLHNKLREYGSKDVAGA
jgi:DNA-binding NtrC family response regulator